VGRTLRLPRLKTAKQHGQLCLDRLPLSGLGQMRGKKVREIRKVFNQPTARLAQDANSIAQLKTPALAKPHFC